MNNGGFLKEPFMCPFFQKIFCMPGCIPATGNHLSTRTEYAQKLSRRLVSSSRYEGVTLQPQTGIASDEPPLY
jgi:hypothetical protein